MLERAIETAKKRYKSELPRIEGDKLSIVLSNAGLSFPLVRRLVIIGYIFRNFEKSDSEIQQELGVSIATVCNLRRKIALPREMYSHGGDRRSKNWRKANVRTLS